MQQVTVNSMSLCSLRDDSEHVEMPTLESVDISIMDVTQQWFDYLHNTRKLSNKVIEEAKLFIDGQWLGIPVFDESGAIIFSKYRKAPWSDPALPKYRYEVGSTAHLYGVEKIGTGELTIVEGEFDVLALRTCGYQAVSSTGGSQTFREGWVSIIAGGDSGRTVNVMYDNDIAGLKGSVRVALMLKECRFRWIPPLYGKDINDVLINFGAEKVHEIMTGVDNFLALSIPSLETEASIKAYRKQLSDTLKNMSSGSVGTLFLRELIVQLSCMLSTVKNSKRKEPIDDSRLAYAKAYPIGNLIKVNRAHKASCIFHNEKTESMHIYPNGTFYCFGCGKHGDVLDIYAQLHNLDIKNPLHFRRILDELCNLSM